MSDFAIVLEWFAFIVRWTHVAVGVAWIGASFYFLARDLGLRKTDDLPEGVVGEQWQIHGGGFFQIRKHEIAPPGLPEGLGMFKWESYWTWLTGFLMLAIVYYIGADLYLIDRNVLDVSAPVAILISVSSLALGWVIYHTICNALVGWDPNRLMMLLFLLLVAVAWGYSQVFSGRAALLHLGAFTATIMSGNVFFVVVPNGQKAVAALKAGQEPDPVLKAHTRHRGTHNKYLALPVLFLMLSIHYPLAFATEYNWIIASLIFLIGVLIRYFFSALHAGKGMPFWTWFAALLILVVIMWLSSAPQLPGQTRSGATAERFMDNPDFARVSDVVLGRCAMCHAAEPFWDGVQQAPGHVMLENDVQVAEFARAIYIQSGRTTAMPPGNVSMMTEEERALIVRWYQAVTGERSL